MRPVDNAAELITGILGGGLVLLVPVVTKAVRDWREGRIKKDDTAIMRWREIAEERQRSERKAWEIVAGYRRWYPHLWTAYVRYTGDRDTFPVDPTLDDGSPYHGHKPKGQEDE